MIHQRRKTTLIPNRAYASSGVLPSVPVTLPAAPWEDAVMVTVPPRPINTGKAQCVRIMGQQFPSLTKAAELLAVDKRTLMEAYRTGRIDNLLGNLLKRETTGQRPHKTITALFAKQAR